MPIHITSASVANDPSSIKISRRHKSDYTKRTCISYMPGKPIHWRVVPISKTDPRRVIDSSRLQRTEAPRAIIVVKSPVCRRREPQRSPTKRHTLPRGRCSLLLNLAQYGSSPRAHSPICTRPRTDEVPLGSCRWPCPRETGPNQRQIEEDPLERKKCGRTRDKGAPTSFHLHRGCRYQ